MGMRPITPRAFSVVGKLFQAILRDFIKEAGGFAGDRSAHA